MKKLALTIAASALISFSAQSAFATTSATNWNNHTGWYAEGVAGAGIIHLNSNILGFIKNKSSTKSAGVGLGLAGGYSFVKWFAVEAGVMQNVFHSDNATSFYTAGRFTLPIGSQFSAFAKIGLSYVRNGGGASGLFGGLGVAYAISQHMDVEALYQSTEGAEGGLGVAGVGVAYHF